MFHGKWKDAIPSLPYPHSQLAYQKPPLPDFLQYQVTLLSLWQTPNHTCLVHYSTRQHVKLVKWSHFILWKPGLTLVVWATRVKLEYKLTVTFSCNPWCHLFPTVVAERCQLWRNKYLEVIDTEGTKSYIFIKGSYYTSYQLEPFISYRNSTTGEWQSFNLSGNVLVLQNGPDPSYLQIKVWYFSKFMETVGTVDPLLI